VFFLLLCRQRQSSKPDVIETDPLQIFLAAVENSKPVIGVRGTKKGGKVYQVINIEPFYTGDFQCQFLFQFPKRFFSRTLQPAAVSELIDRDTSQGLQ